MSFQVTLSIIRNKSMRLLFYAFERKRKQIMITTGSNQTLKKQISDDDVSVSLSKKEV